jgi:DNA polymerase-1
MALNTPIQGSSADIIKKAMIDIYNEFKKRNLKSKMILQVHDELIFDVANNEKDIVLKIVTELMEHCYELNVPLKVETSFGKNWYQTK